MLIIDGPRHQILNDLALLSERARDLFPGDELGDLFSQLPELLKVDVAVHQAVGIGGGACK